MEPDNASMSAERTTPDLSLVIPVYNGSRTIGPLVERITTVFGFTPFEIVLVNDGSEDDSEMVCAKLAEKFPQNVTFVHLSRNFGEHSAVLAGLSHACGRYIAGYRRRRPESSGRSDVDAGGAKAQGP